MAEGFLRSLDPRLEVYSAGTEPAPHVHPKAAEVMREIGIDLSGHQPKPVDAFLGSSFDWVITVCDDADRNCPAFAGPVRHRLHMGFEDPARAQGTEEEILAVFRRVRDQIVERFERLYRERILPELEPQAAEGAR